MSMETGAQISGEELRVRIDVATPEPQPAFVGEARLSEVGAADLALRTPPLAIRIERHDGEVVASWPEVEVWASGVDEASAINALKDEIVALYRDLANEDDARLGKIPARWKRALRIAIEARH